MTGATALKTGPADPIEAIQGRILKKTWGRINLLRVEMADGSIVVHGLAQSYYDKQLVIQAVLEMTHGDPSVPIALDIEVLDRDRRKGLELTAPALGI